jgi:perosamine synthetase
MTQLNITSNRYRECSGYNRDSAAFAEAFVTELRALSGASSPTVALHEPRFSGNEWVFLKECIDTGWVSSAGKFVNKFEMAIAECCQAAHAVAVVNGTAALHLALILANVKPGDEVLIPALTFVATANAVVYAGAIPHFCDSELNTLGIDPVALRHYLSNIVDRSEGATINRKTGRRIAALVPMHTYGHPVDMDSLLSVAADFELSLVEDATESLGSRYKGRACGAIGHVGALSFNGNKIVTTGGGGAIVTNNPNLAKAAKHLTTTAKIPHEWAFWHDAVGYNYRMPNINAALGCAQLEKLNEFLTAKRRLAQRYIAGFANFAGLKVVREPAFAQSNYWLNAVLLDEDRAYCRDEILETANAAGLQCRPAWTLMHRLPMFAGAPHMDLAVAQSIEARLINIPSSAILAAATDGV